MTVPVHQVAVAMTAEILAAAGPAIILLIQQRLAALGYSDVPVNLTLLTP